MQSTRPRHRVFPGRANQIAHVRDFARRTLAACPVLDEAVLLVSELATNAVEHTDTGNTGHFHVTIYHHETWLLIAIKDDGSDTTPTTCRVDLLAECGRGLGLVELIAHRWGHCDDERGRTVWFELRWMRPTRDQSFPQRASLRA